MQITIRNKKHQETIRKNMEKRGYKKLTEYFVAMANRDANDLGLIKIEDLI